MVNADVPNLFDVFDAVVKNEGGCERPSPFLHKIYNKMNRTRDQAEILELRKKGLRYCGVIMVGVLLNV